MNELGDDCIILDTEATDRENGECIELAWLSTTDIFDATAVSHTKRMRFKPETPSKLGALAVHGILDHELDRCPASATACAALPPARFWIGHNIDFDWMVLGRPAQPFRICTLALARKHWPEADSHSLSAMMYHLFGRNETTRDLVKNAHGALADVLMTRMLLDEVIRKTGVETLVGMFAESEDARVPRKWGFGKFADQPISAADRGYASWFTKNCRDRPDYQYYLVALKRVGLA